MNIKPTPYTNCRRGLAIEFVGGPSAPQAIHPCPHPSPPHHPTTIDIVTAIACDQRGEIGKGGIHQCQGGYINVERRRQMPLATFEWHFSSEAVPRESTTNQPTHPPTCMGSIPVVRTCISRHCATATARDRPSCERKNRRAPPQQEGEKGQCSLIDMTHSSQTPHARNDR